MINMKTSIKSMKSVVAIALAALAGVGAYGANALKLETPSLVTNSVNWSGGGGTGGTVTNAQIGEFGATPSATSLAGLTLQGTNITLGGLQFDSNMNGPATITDSSTLTVGASGINCTNNATLNCPVVLGAAQSWNVFSANTLAVGGVISGTGSLTVSGPGTLTLSGANTYTNTTTISAGQVNIGNWGAATLGTITVGNATNTATLAITGGTLGLGANSLVVGNGASTSYVGIVNQSGGTVSFTSLNALLLGNGSGSTGTYNLSGGTLTSYASSTRGVMIGVNSGTNNATFNLSGTGNLSLGAALLEVGRSDSTATNCTAVYNQTGGTATLGYLTIGGGSASTTTTATFSLTGGSLVATNFPTLVGAASSSATITLGGSAQVTLPAFPVPTGPANLTFDFTSGSLSPLAASGTYMSGLTHAYLTANGVNFNVGGGKNITVAQAFQDKTTGGTLTKTGPGTLTLSGVSTYTGATTVSAGELIGVTGGSISSTTSFTVAAGATNGVQLAAANGQWTTANLIANNGSVLDINLNGFAPSTTVAPLQVVGNFASSSALNFIVRGASLPVGTYPLVKYGTQSGALPSSPLVLANRASGYLSNDLATAAIYLVVTSSSDEPLTWTAASSTTWNTADVDWHDANNNSTTYLDGLDSVVFDDTANGTTPLTVNLTNVFSPVSVTVNNTNKAYTISGTGGVIAGSCSLTKNGTGTLTLGTANTFSGGLVIGGGQVTLNNSAGAGSGTITLNNGTTLLANGTSVTPGNAVAVAAGATATVENSNVSPGFGGNISSGDGNAVLTINDTSLSGTTDQLDHFTGTVNIGASSVRFSSSGSNGGTNTTFNLIGSLYCRNAGSTENIGALTGSGTLQGASGSSPGAATINLGAKNINATFTGVISENGATSATTVNKIGAGTQVLAGTNTYVGPTIVSAGELDGGTGGAISNSPSLTVYTNAAFGVKVGSSGGKWTGTNLVLRSGSSLVFNYGTVTPSPTVAPLQLLSGITATNTVTLNVLGGSSWAAGVYPLAKYTGAYVGNGYAAFSLGTLPLRVLGVLSNDTANSQIDLVVTSYNEPLKWAAGNTNWDISASSVWKDAAANLTTYQEQIGLGDQVVFDDTATGASPITVTLNTNVTPASVTFNNTTKNYVLAGVSNILGAIGLTKTGPGTLTIQNTNSFSGALNLNGGIVNFGGLANLGAGTAINFGGGTLQYAAGNTADISIRTVTINPAGATIDTAGNNVSFAKRIGNSGTGGLTKTGAGNLTLNTNIAYSGLTLVNQGSLVLGAGASLSNSAAIVVNPGTTLDASTTGFGFNLNGAVNQILAGSGTVTGIVATANGTTITPGTNGIVGTLTFGNDLNLNGGTYVFDVATTSHDLLVVGGNLNIQNPAGGTLTINPLNALTNGTYKLIQYAGAYNSGLAGLTLSGGQANKIFALSDTTSGEIDLVVTSSGTNNLTWTGDGANNYWDIDNSANWFDNHLLTGGVVFDNGDTVTFDDSYVNSGSESPAVSIESSSVSPTAVVVNTTNIYTFDGYKITGGATTLTKNGTGALILATVGNDYGGATVINNGALQIGDGSTGGTSIGVGNVTNNAALIFDQPDNSSVLGNLSGSGTLYQLGANSSATLTLLGNNSYNGLTTVDTGILQIGNGGLSGTLGTGAVVLTNGAILNLNRSGIYTLANGISGNGTLEFNGAATVTFGGVNSYLNNTYINSGVVKLAGNNVIPSGGLTTGWLVLDGGASAAGTLDLNGHNQTVNTLSGLTGTVLGQIVNNGGSALNTLTVVTTNANTTYAGLIENNNNSGLGQVGLNILGDGSLTYALTLSGASSYSGPVVINGASVILAGSVSAVGDAAIGTGSVTLTNGGSLQMNGIGNQSTTCYFVNSILVPAGTTGYLKTGGRTVYSGSVTVHGTLNLTTSYVRSEPTGDWSASDGQINILAGTSGGDVYLSTTSGFNFGTAAINLGAGTHLYNSVDYGGSINLTIGELTGTGTISDDTAVGPLSRTTIYVVGGRNTVATFSGTIANQSRATGINKVGSGSWTLNGTDTYSGPTTVTAGSLIVGSSSFMAASTPITVAAGALLDVSAYGGLSFAVSQTLTGSGVVTGAVTLVDSDILLPGSSTASGTLSFSNNLTLGSGSGSYAVTNNFALSSDPTGVRLANSQVIVAGDLTLTGTNLVVINPLNTILGAGNYTLFQYGGTLYNEAGAVPVGTLLPNNLMAAGAFPTTSDVSLTFSNAQNAVVMIVTPNGQNLTWTGGATNNWDLDISTNWVNSAPALTNFFTYDNVTFTNGTTNLTATLVGTLAPGSVVVNSDSNYVFAGSGKLTGNTGIAKGGNGTLTISDTGGNDFTGTITINNGVLKTGVATALGATNGPTIVTNTGALDVGGQNLGAEPFILSGSGSGSGAILNSGATTLNALQFVTLAGDTTFGGPNRWDIRTNGTLGAYLQGNGHNLIKTGTNDIYLVNVGKANLGNVTIQSGRIGLQDNTSLGSSGTLTLNSGAGLDLWDTTVTNSMAVSLTSATVSGSSSTNVFGGATALNGVCFFTATTPLQLNGALGGSGGLVANGASTLTLNATETYTGNTTISNGVLALTSAASIATSTNVDVATNAQLNVSALAGSTLILGAEQTLKGLGTVSGSVTAPAGATVAPGEAGAMGTLTITNNLTVNGNLMINYNRGATSKSSAITAATINLTGATLIMTNLNPANPLAAGDSFQLFNGATVTGGFSSIVPATPGTGLVWNTNSLISAHLLLVAAAPSAVTALGITSFSLAGTNVVVNGTNAGGGTFYLLTSTNLAQALNQWLPVSTNSAAGSGSFTLTNAMMLNVPQQFFILSTNNP